MKGIKLLVAATFVFALLSGGAVHAADKKDIKIAYVDLSRLFDGYFKTKEYDKVLEGKNKEYEKARNEKMDKIKEAQGNLSLTKEDKKAPIEAEIEKSKAELLEWDRQKKTDLTKERNEKIREILLEIEKIVSGFAEKEGFSMILNDRVLIYDDQTLNVTEQVLKLLNENKPADSGKGDKK